MNKKLKAVLAVALLSGTTLYAADNGIGTAQDPVVTKSYVDVKIAEVSQNAGVNSELVAKINAQDEMIAMLIKQIAELQSNQAGFEIVNVPAEKIIYGKQGSEMIIRSGEGIIVASAAGGVQDVTDGVDLQGGVVAPKNNLLIIPREDGRGLRATKTMVVMVRGGYTIL